MSGRNTNQPFSVTLRLEYVDAREIRHHRTAISGGI